MMRNEQIFFGVTPKAFRDYLTSIFREKRSKYPRVVLPCAGQFTEAKLAVDSGYEPQKVITSDISLFSTALGCILNGAPLSSIGLRFNNAWEGYNVYLEQDQPLALAAALFVIRYCQMKETNAYLKSIRDEYARRADELILGLAHHIKKMAESLKGISYQVKDMWEELEDNVGRDDTIIFLAPPVYSADNYVKIFETGGALSWNEPTIRYFDPKKDYPRLYELVEGKPALTLLYKIERVEPQASKNIVFSAEMAKKKFYYIVANRPQECKRYVSFKGETKVKPSKWPMIPRDYRITKKSTVSMVCVGREVALYYRMCLAHNFGVASADCYYLAILDGYMWAICGFALRNAYTGRNPIVFETFGFSVPLLNHHRSHKLFNMLLVTQEFKDVLFRDNPKLEMVEVEKFQTTCFTKFPSLSHQRGITKLKERINLPDGTYKLIYESEFKPMSFKTCIRQWLQKEGSK